MKSPRRTLEAHATFLLSLLKFWHSYPASPPGNVKSISTCPVSFPRRLTINMEEARMEAAILLKRPKSCEISPNGKLSVRTISAGPREELWPQLLDSIPRTNGLHPVDSSGNLIVIID